jgi:hypothetical protein
MTINDQVRNQVIKWNQDKAKRAKTPEDKARYEENIRNLQDL